MMPCRFRPLVPTRAVAVLAARALLTLALALVATVATPVLAAGDELGVNVFGFSHHLKNPYGDELHEFNPGLGLQWTFARDRRSSLDGNVGIYADTFGHANYHLSLGGRVRVAGPVDIGVQMINAVSASLADGEPVLTPYPFLAARLGRVTWNVAYIPEVQSFNAMPAVATFVTVRPWRDDDSDGEAPAPADAEAPGAGSALEFTVPRVPALSGLHERGFIWRHMFDDRRGLRLGFELLGTVTTSHYPDATYGPDGEYEASLLTQYLWRQAPRGRWRTYWATGLEVQFLAGSYYSSSVLETWRTDLGAECTLGGGLALAAEYGVRLEYNAYPAHGGPGEVSRSLNIAGSSGRLALVVTRPDGRAATAAAVGGTMAGSGPVVLLGSDFTLAPFEGAAFAWQWRPASSAAWRLAVTPQVRNHHDGPTRAEKYALGLRLERLHYRRGSGAAAYWGLGALAAFDYNSSRSTEVVPDFELPNWIFYHASADQRAALPRLVRLQLLKNVLSAAVYRNPDLDFGLTIFAGNDGGRVVVRCGASTSSLLAGLAGLAADEGAPLAEAAEDVLAEFHRSDTQAPFAEAGALGFCLIVAAGLPTWDLDVSPYLRDADGDGEDPGTCTSLGAAYPDSCGCSSYLDDVTWYLAHTDLRPDLAGAQNLRTSVVGFLVDHPLLASAAVQGGGDYVAAADPQALVDGVAVALAGIRARLETAADAPAVPSVVARLLPARPNPFNPAVTISFDLATGQAVRLTVHDPSGRHVTTLADANFAPGRHDLTWNGRLKDGAAAPSGVYFFQLEAAGVLQVVKAALLK